ncbi:MAG: DNA primase [Chloroflexota bacterium]
MSITDDIKVRVDLVELVSGYVPDLKRSGKNYHARCPFHQERTPSFVVFPDKQTWRCFGACATGGDAFTFLQRIENLEFPDALKELARRAGVELPEHHARVQEESPLYGVNEAAGRFFRDQLLSDAGSLARAYAAERGLTDEAIVRFGLGYAPATGDALLRKLGPLGVAEEQVVAAGLATRLDSGDARDLLRGRLTFTLRDGDGRIAGFAGRSLDGANPKYLNTPQTPIFDKGRMLYAFERAKEAMAREGVAVVVEGYMDAIAAHEHGYANVVASMGTALTEQQVALLRARAGRIVLALDTDAAGQEAMRRSLWQVAEEAIAAGTGTGRTKAQGLDAWAVAALRDGKDPDEIIRTDPARWRAMVGDAVPVLDFLLEAERARGALTTAQENAPTVLRFGTLIRGLADWGAQDRYLDRLAAALGVTRPALEAALARMAPPSTPVRRTRRKAPAAASEEAGAVLRSAARDVLEEYALALLIQSPELAGRAVELPEEHLRRADARALLRALSSAGTIEGARALLDEASGAEWDRLAAKVMPPADRTQRELDWAACLRRLEERHLRELKVQEEAALAAVPTPDDSQDGEDEGYRETVERAALTVNQRLRDLFAG